MKQIFSLLAALTIFASGVRADTLVGDTAKPAALFGEICAALKANVAKPNVVKVRAGLYVIPALAGTDNAAAWKFSGDNALKDCTVDLTGVTLAFAGSNGTNLEFQDCSNATFRGATVYKIVPSFTQGTVTAFQQTDAENWQMDLKVDKGYLVAPFVGAQAGTGDARFTVHIFDPKIRDANGRPAWQTGGGYFHTNAIVPTDEPNTIRLIFKERHVLAIPSVGDRLVLRSKAGFSTTVKDCTHMTFQNLKLTNNGLYGIVEFGGANTTYDSVQITYGPPPPGATELPIVASTADGIHCLYGNPGPTFKNCLIEGTPDDGIAIHGAFYAVDAVVSDTVLGIVGKGHAANTTQRFEKGDTMRISDDASHFYADAVVTGARLVGDSWQYTLDHAVSAKAGFLVSNPNLSGHGYKILNTTVRRNRARGMLLKADDGLVQNCVIEDSTIAGIVLSPETGGNEAGYVHNVTLIGNTIRHTGYAETGGWTPYAPGISVTGSGSIGNRNITIQDNIFDQIVGANVLVRFTDGAKITGNRFLNTHQVASEIGKGAGIDASTVIWIGDSRNVTLTDNTVANQGTFGKSLIVVAPSATDVQGAETGVSRAK